MDINLKISSSFCWNQFLIGQTFHYIRDLLGNRKLEGTASNRDASYIRNKKKYLNKQISLSNAVHIPIKSILRRKVLGDADQFLGKV